MNPWTQVVIEALQRQPILPLYEPCYVLGEIQCDEDSWIVAVAWKGVDPPRIAITVQSIVLVRYTSYQSKRPGQWVARSAKTGRGNPSPLNTIVLNRFRFHDSWFILGTLINPDIAAATIRPVGGPILNPDIQNRGFLLLIEGDEFHQHVRVLDRSGQAMEEFYFPFRTYPLVPGNVKREA
jgi:hypothetical protein